MNGSDVVVARGDGIPAHLAYDLDGQVATVDGRLLELSPSGGVWECARPVVPDGALEATVGLTTHIGVLVVRVASVEGPVARFTLQVRDNATLMEIQGALLAS